LLAACGTGPSRALFACPTLEQYSQEFLARAADELMQLPADSAIDELLRDYKSLRDQVRACQAAAIAATALPFRG